MEQSDAPRRESISLPSTQRTARVSISSNNGDADHLTSSSTHGEGVYGQQRRRTSRHDDGNDVNNGQLHFFSSAASPMPATQRLYSSLGSSSARSPAAVGTGAGAGFRRTSFGDMSGQAISTHNLSNQVTSPVLSGSISSSSRHGALPSILPSSAFLTPRKPSYTPRQYQSGGGNNNDNNNDNHNTLASDAHFPYDGRTVKQNTEATSPDADSIFADQQSQPSIFLSNNKTADNDHHATGNTTGTSTSISRQNSLSNHGHGNSSTGDESNAGTVNSLNIGGSHARSDSRHGTIVSKASREPLITTDGNKSHMSSDIRHTRNGSKDYAGNSKRHTSRTGSITGLLNIRNSQAGDQSRPPPLLASSAQHQNQHMMPTVGEGSERMSSNPARPSSAPAQGRFLHSHNIDRPYYVEAQHTAVPILSSKTNRPLRNYQVYREMQRQQKQNGSGKASQDPTDKEKPTQEAMNSSYGGNNRFFLSGRLVTSGDSVFPFLASFIVAVTLPALFYAFESEWLWNAGADGIGSPGGKALIFLFTYSVLIMWTSMLRTSLRDPGIIRKGLDKEPDWESCAVPVGSEDDMTGTGMGQRAKLRYFRIKDELVSSKWCDTCQTYRPPRTSHCRLCDVCTEQTDHHCSFLNNCIGRRNYSSFIAFLISTTFASWFAIAVSVAHLASNASDNDGFWSDWRNIGSIVLLILVSGMAIPIMGLLSYHMRLIWLSRTTIEMLRPKYPSNPEGPNKGRPSNPYAFSRRIDTIIYNLCKPMDLYSAIQPHALAEKDGRLENPAFAT